MSIDRVLHMPTGETLTFLRTGAETDGLAFELEAVLPPGLAGPPAHRHQFETESFTVVEGILRVRLGRETRELGAGDTVRVPPGMVHAFGNPSDKPTRIRTLESPAGPLEEQFRALADAGKLPPLRKLARINRAHDMSFVLHGVPAPVQRLLWRALAALPGGEGGRR